MSTPIAALQPRISNSLAALPISFGCKGDLSLSDTHQADLAIAYIMQAIQLRPYEQQRMREILWEANDRLAELHACKHGR